MFKLKLLKFSITRFFRQVTSNNQTCSGISFLKYNTFIEVKRFLDCKGLKLLCCLQSVLKETLNVS
jgi:hypothetical protein